MMINMLHRLIILSTDEFLSMMESHIQFLPSEKSLEDSDITSTLEQPREEGPLQV